jgi:cytochrome c-type biogenesis protein CcmH
MLWLVFAGLAVLVFGSLAYPLIKRSGGSAPGHIDFDVAVYRDQLEELKEEIDRGILTEDQAAAARTEIHRRILAAEDAGNDKVETGQRNNRLAALFALAIIGVIAPVGGFAMYSVLGSPQLAGEPYSWRGRNDATVAAARTTDELEKLLKQAPTAAGYKRLANMYFANGQYDKAVSADHRAIDLGADDATIWSEFGESIVMASDGQVIPPALVAFTNAIGRDPSDARARYYIGSAEAQIGHLRQAVAIWRDLERDADPSAKWLPMVRQHVIAFSKQGGFDPASIRPAAPSAEALRSSVTAMTAAINQKSVASAAGAPPADTANSGADTQDAMIRGMVERLATRMKTSPNDAAGWTRLAHAYNVLGEPEKAQDAIAHAVRLKPNDIDVRLTLAETEKAARLPRKP